MRVIAGKYRGRILAEFKGRAVRPTSDRVKESVFEILSRRFQGARVLDLFCGSGALGIESLSRGAEEVIFNDSSRESVLLTKKNLAALKCEGKVLQMDYAAALGAVSGKFDLIFVDPPYSSGLYTRVLELIAQYDRLNTDGRVVCESEEEFAVPACYRIADVRAYGRTRVTFLESI